jgi:hypothetical protein
LGELGGDRVVPSNDLKETLVRNDRIRPYRRTYALRQPTITQPVETIRYRESLFDGVSLPGAACSDKTRPRRLDRAEPGQAAQASFFSMSGWCLSD